MVFLGCGIRHLRGFWFSRELRGDQGEAGALAEGRPGVDGLGAVWRQHSAILPDAPCDGQTGFVPHGFCKCQLRRKIRTDLWSEQREDKNCGAADWSFRTRFTLLCHLLPSTLSCTCNTQIDTIYYL